MADGNVFGRLDPAYQDALLRGIDLSIDEGFDDVAALMRGKPWDELLFLNGALPDRPIYVQRYKPLFAKQFLVCLVAVAGKLTSGREFTLASVAEELALYTIIERATGPSGEEEFDFGDFIEEVFEDTDFLWLFDEKYNGIQHTPAQNTLRTANLDFEDWFKPFRDAESVHPYCWEQEPESGRSDRPPEGSRLN
ncbi:MAG TPA: hypothetical protein VFC31_02675 [Candidatus Limnocylindria bacterium]|nr:hypothetical protein [Candidatus Limnocylindria bacterium]